MELNRAFHISSKTHLVAILACLFFLDGFALWYAATTDYQQTVERTRSELLKTAMSLEERMRRSISVTELLLKHLAERIEQKGIEAASSSPDARQEIKSHAATLPDKGSLWLMNKDGDCVLTSLDHPVWNVNFSDAEYFKPQRDLGITTYVGPVVKGGGVRNYSFTISRRINGPDGSFQGIVLAAMHTDDFTNFLRDISIGENAAVSVWRTDSSLILRQPMEDRFLDGKHPDSELFRMCLSNSGSGTFATDGAMDARAMLVAYKRFEGMPLLAVTSVPLSDIQKQWLARVKHYSLIAAFALVALVGLSWLVHRSTSREETIRVELLENQRQLREHAERLEQSNSALDEFASIASHDLQEPLRKISSFGRMLEESYGTALGEGGMLCVDRMLDAARRMQCLVEDLLDYSRLSSRAKPFTSVDLAPLIREVLSDLEVSIEGTGAEVRVEEMPAVRADPVQMRQLFQNLIGNALKFHKEGEKPLVTVGPAEADKGTWRIAVSDNGIGFDEKHIERIFSPFQRLHGRSSPYKGTGMGLAICKKIAERHGGSIMAKSTPGDGATFVVTLPAVPSRKDP